MQPSAMKETVLVLQQHHIKEELKSTIEDWWISVSMKTNSELCQNLT